MQPQEKPSCSYAWCFRYYSKTIEASSDKEFRKNLINGYSSGKVPRNFLKFHDNMEKLVENARYIILLTV